MTATDTLGVLRDYLFGDLAARLLASAALADEFEAAGDQSAADSLRAAPSLTAVPNLLMLARPLDSTDVARLCGKLLDRTDVGNGFDFVVVLLSVMRPDGRADFVELVARAAEYAKFPLLQE